MSTARLYTPPLPQQISKMNKTTFTGRKSRPGAKSIVKKQKKLAKQESEYWDKLLQLQKEQQEGV